jgi:hypothetical protein
MIDYTHDYNPHDDGEADELDTFDVEDDSQDNWEADEDDYDGQPDEYTEWQDLHGGDDWDHGQYDNGDDY